MFCFSSDFSAKEPGSFLRNQEVAFDIADDSPLIFFHNAQAALGMPAFPDFRLDFWAFNLTFSKY
jgi:hypothetical protein